MLPVFPKPVLSHDVTAGGTEILTLDGAFADRDPEIAGELSRAIDVSHGDVVVDLRGLVSIDAELAQTLRAELERCQSQGRSAIVVRPATHLWRRLTLAGVDGSCVSCDCLREALAASAGGMTHA